MLHVFFGLLTMGIGTTILWAGFRSTAKYLHDTSKTTTQVMGSVMIEGIGLLLCLSGLVLMLS